MHKHTLYVRNFHKIHALVLLRYKLFVLNDGARLAARKNMMVFHGRVFGVHAPFGLMATDGELGQ